MDAARLLAEASAITVLTGAGMSTGSGIPDYRGPNGTWTRDPEAERLATLDHYLNDAAVRRRSWRNRLTSPLWTAQPNAAHRALTSLGNLTAVVTQNVDGLHQAAGHPPDRVIELHGNAHRTRCWTCKDERPMAEALDRVRAGEEDPPCRACGGVLKSATILFGESLDQDVIDRASRAADGADVLLAAGTSLAVYPAAGLVPRARRRGAKVVIANAEPTPYDAVADAVVRGDLSAVLPRLVGEC